MPNAEHQELTLLEQIVQALLGKEDGYSFERAIDEKGVLLTLTIDNPDAGRIIGKKGDTAKAIRTILRQLGLRTNATYSLKIVVTGEEQSNGDTPS